MPRPLLRRPALAGVLLLLPLAACQGGEPPDPVFDDLASGLAGRDLGGVPLDDPAADDQLAEIWAAVPEDQQVTVEAGAVTTEDDTASATLDWTWQLDGTEWSYQTPVEATRVDDAWQVSWSPAVVAPDLAPGESLAIGTLPAERGPVLGAGDSTIVGPRPVVRLGLDKTQAEPGAWTSSARAIARQLDVGVGDYVARVEAAGEKAFVEALVLRADDAASTLTPAYADIPGAARIEDELPLALTREFAAPLLGTVGDATAEVVEESDGAIAAGDVVGLSGLQARYDEQLRGTPGVRVSATGGEADRTLFEQAPVAGQPLRLSLDPALQQKAEQALAGTGPVSALVAIRPSTGDVLAAANGPGNDGLNAATFGQYAPGSTFKVVSSLALLRAGLTPDTPVACDATTVVDGKSFKNYDDYPASGVGRITLRQAVANSCNTAFISQRDRLDDTALTEAAGSLGLGIDRDLGFPAYFGQVPTPQGETEKAADLIGQGTVLASPMAMAAVAASVSAGTTVTPRLVLDHDVPPPASEPAPLTAREAQLLRGLMRAVVTEGSGRFLAGLPGEVGAKTGTAEYGTPDASGSLPTHTWMIATQGDLAVAVFVETGASGSQTAGPLLEQFLR
ncbi:penicillin-binding transpeptidase domain-containing protein [Nocardioides sp. Soil805]|uniref:penicillin-binding transpeptidase domain-containing protein n=1 Tax=Nocardioides sp. Soil805 TaxID=1736416 RepID=UPI0019102BD1|nr:penicillin-binding transpeptidase domain-containing protein [Nocardioides sp. Soil805]